MPLAIVVFIAWLLGVAAQSSYLDAVRFNNAEHRWRERSIYDLANAIRQFNRETGSFPTDLNQLTQRPGNEYLSLLKTQTWQGYAKTTAQINDGIWKFDRIAVFSQFGDTAGTSTDYLAKSSCAVSGTPQFATDANWCGDEMAFWWRYESRDDYSNQIVAEREAQTRVMQKFVATYQVVINNIQAFPDIGGGLTSKNLYALVGAPSDPLQCSGVWLWQGIPFDCGDLFSVWGTPRTYNRFSDDKIAILSMTNFVNNAGNAVPVSTQLDFENMERE